MKNVSAGKVTSGPNGKPSIRVSGGPMGIHTSPKMPNVGGHTSNTGNGKPGVKG